MSNRAERRRREKEERKRRARDVSNSAPGLPAVVGRGQSDLALLNDGDGELYFRLLTVWATLNNRINAIEAGDGDEQEKAKRGLIAYQSFAMAIGLNDCHVERIHQLVGALVDARQGISHPATAPRRPMGGSLASLAVVLFREASTSAVEVKYRLLGAKPRGEMAARRAFLKDLQKKAKEAPESFDWQLLFPARDTGVKKSDDERCCDALKDWRRVFDDDKNLPRQAYGEGEEPIHYKGFVDEADMLSDGQKLKTAYDNLLDLVVQRAAILCIV